MLNKGKSQKVNLRDWEKKKKIIQHDSFYLEVNSSMTETENSNVQNTFG